jgi:formylglycine-generating enzyme required for sulfatase activity
VPAGTYRVGSPKGVGDADEHPQHAVHLEKDFWIASVPVTNAHYAAFDPGLEPYAWQGIESEELAFHPRVQITWFAAQAFCTWLSRLYPGARLPTEEEWEIACRAGSEKEYWSGDSEKHLKDVGWYDANSKGRTWRVGKKKANPFGLYDVHGNVREWTLSRFSGSSYAGRSRGYPLDSQEVSPEPEANPAGGVTRVLRGGSYGFTAGRARSAYRSGGLPRSDWRIHGFRVLLPHSPRAMDGRS